MQLGHVYPAANAPEAQQTIIDVSQYEEQQLMQAADNTYPLVFRLETISEKGAADRHTLQVCMRSMQSHAIGAVS